MKVFQKYLKGIGFFLLGLFILAIILTCFNLLGLFSSKVSSILLNIFMMIFFLFLGMNYGKHTNKKGYLEGLKIGFLFIMILFVTNIIFFDSSFPINRLIYYILLLASATFGSILGINKKKL